VKLRDREFSRGLLWLCVGVVGALLIGHAADFGLNEYAQRWLGACLKVATGAWGGYRISRDICRIDPSKGVAVGFPVDTTTFAMMHLARAIVVTGTILAVCLAV
jgi:hypothetical protein